MRIIKEGTIYFGVSIFERVVPFILMPFLTRILSVEEYGVISIFWTVAALYSILVGVGLDGFIRVIYHKSTNHEFSQYVGNVLTLSFISLLVISFFTVIFRDKITGISGIENNLLYLVVLVTYAQFLINLRLVVFQTKRQALRYGKLQVIRPVLDLILVLFLLFYLSGGAEERIYSYVISTVVVAVIACLLLYRDNLFYFKLDKLSSFRALRFSLPLLPHTIALTAFVTVDKLILSANVGLSIVGELAVALSLASPTLIITESINRSFMPWSFAKFRSGNLDMVVGASYVLLILMFFVCLAYSGLLFLFFDILVGKSFHNAFLPTMMLVWLGWLKLAYYIVIKGIVYCEKTTYLTMVSVTAGTIYIGLVWTNIQGITLVEISLFMIIFQAVMFVGVLILSQLIYPQPWGQVAAVKDVMLLLLSYMRQFKKVSL